MNDQSTRELRTRQARTIETSDRLVGPPPSSPSTMVVVTVAVSAYPSSAGLYYACQRLAVDGPEVEGGAAGFTTLPGILYVAVLDGSTPPPAGTKLVVDSVDGRWVVRS